MEFKEKVQAMSAKEIIMAMIEGLRNPITHINMGTYGDIINGICYGCAATNTICNIANLDIDYLYNNKPKGTMALIFSEKPTKYIEYDEGESFLNYFESAINSLREGDIGSYNFYAKDINISLIEPNEPLPYLNNSYTEEELLEYVKLANFQDEKNI